MNDDRTRARQQSIGDIPRRSAARYPDKLAVVHRDVRLTFAEFDTLIDRVAAALHSEGLTRGDRLALLSHNCWQYPVLNFATARLGVVLVPVNFMLTGGEIGYILDDCAADAFVVEDALVPVAEKALAESKGSVRVRATIPLGDAATPDGWRRASLAVAGAIGLLCLVAIVRKYSTPDVQQATARRSTVAV